MRRLEPDKSVPSFWLERAESAGGSESSESDSHLERVAIETEIARERGFQEGYAEGANLARQELQRQFDARTEDAKRREAAALQKMEQAKKILEGLIDAIPQAIEDQARATHETAVLAAFSAVTKFFDERYADATMMAGLVRHALAHTAPRVDAIRVSTQDLEALREVAGVNVVADPRLQSGQCVLETGLGQYETGIDVRLDLLRTAFLSGLARFQEETKS